MNGFGHLENKNDTWNLEIMSTVVSMASYRINTDKLNLRVDKQIISYSKLFSCKKKMFIYTTQLELKQMKRPWSRTDTIKFDILTQLPNRKGMQTRRHKVLSARAKSHEDSCHQTILKKMNKMSKTNGKRTKIGIRINHNNSNALELSGMNYLVA